MGEHTSGCACQFCAAMKSRVGYRGQKYRVTQVKSDGGVQVWGWTDEQGGGVLASSCMKHPETAIVRVEEEASYARRNNP